MFRLLLIFASFLIVANCARQTGEFIPYYQTETSKPYDDVLSELEIAIAENNFRVTGHSRVGKVIRERGARNFPEYDTIQFCNLTHARHILEIEPEAIRFMPCNVVMYQFKGKTVVRTHLLPEQSENEELNRFAAKMNVILKGIVDFAVDE